MVVKSKAKMTVNPKLSAIADLADRVAKLEAELAKGLTATTTVKPS